VSDNKIVPPKRAEMKRSMEALIHHFKLYNRRLSRAAARCTPPSKPQGRVRLYLIADGTNKP